MSNQVTGQIVHVGPTEQKTDNFSIKTIVLRTEEQYPQEIPVDLVNKKIDDFKHLRENDMVTVEYNLRGRGWTDRNGNKKWQLSLQAWKIQKNN